MSELDADNAPTPTERLKEALRFTDEDIENAYEAMQEDEWQWFQRLLREKAIPIIASEVTAAEQRVRDEAAGAARRTGMAPIAAIIAAHLDGPCDDPRCHLLGRRNVGPVSEHLAEEIVHSLVAPDRDCTATGFSGEGRCIEPAVTDGLCATHARVRAGQ